MTPLAKKVFELFGKPELVAEAERKPAEGQPSTVPQQREEFPPVVGGHSPEASPPSSGLSPQQPRKKDVLTPWGWLSRLSDEDKRRWEERNSWPCRHCGRPAEIEAVEPNLDGQRVLTYWHCPPCQTWGVTPDSIRQPPVWVSRKEQ